MEMRLNEAPFNLIKNGLKRIEVRLNDDKRQKLNIGDEIKFKNRKTGEIINTKVIDLLYYSSFPLLAKNNNISDFGSKNKDKLLASLNALYKEEEVKKYGVLGIVIQLI